MTIMNNSSTAMSLGELNKNINKLGKSLSKLSSGKRIMNASEDAASFAISEKMREQIRSLEQDIQNVQNGTSMLKTAHAGIENIVEELRSLKELAINSANDSNTDDDRKIIQKEFDQRRATIDEIASWTNYNTKPLLDGTYRRANTQLLEDVLSYNYETIKYETNEQGKKVEVSRTTGVAGTIDDRGIYTDGLTNLFSLGTVTAKNKTAASVSWVNDRTVYGNPSRMSSWHRGGYKAYDWVTLNFSSATRRDSGELSVPEDFHKQGFSAFCSDYSGCPSFHGFVFDATMSYGTGEKVYNSSGPVYIVGINGISNEDNESWGTDLADALFEGVKYAIENSTNSPETYTYDYSDDTEKIVLGGYGDAVELMRDGDNVSIMQHYDMWIYEGYDTGAVYKDPLPPSNSGYSESEEGSVGASIISPEYISIVKSKVTEPNPLTIHHGTKANQRTNFFINDMHIRAMGGKAPTEEEISVVQNLSSDRDKQEEYMNLLVEARGVKLDKASVTTQHSAKVAIKVVNDSINYALDEATYLGAYLQRLDYTELNLTTQDENTQGAESTISDADMAKEMTEYTKNNVLTQAAQSMLAQANQNVSGVLSLLQ